MNKHPLAAALAALLTCPVGAGAAGLDDELAAIKARLNALERQLHDQNRTIQQRDREIAELRRGAGSGEAGDAWYDRVEVGGIIEVEASHASSDGQQDTHDLITPTVELGINARINDWVAAELVLLYEEDTNNDDGSGNGSRLNVDTAMLTIADPDGNWFVNAGQYTLPFGAYPTHQVSDPLTLDLGETGDTAVEYGMTFGALTASVYAFQGDRDNRIDNVGAALNLGTTVNGIGFNAHVGVINDLGESDGSVDNGFVSVSDDVAGWTASTEINAGIVTFIAEYVAALDGFNAAGDEPSAYNLETAVAFHLGGRPSTFALGFQGSDDFQAIDNTQVEERILGTLSVEVLDGTTVALEYKTEKDHTGAGTDTVTGLLAVEF